MLSKSHNPSDNTLEITLVAVSAVFLSLATIAIGIRLWSRRIQRCSLVLNDYAAIVAWVRDITKSISLAVG